MKQGLAAAAAGFLFAVGLGLAGMLKPEVVRGFLDFTGSWNPSLALVMGAALAFGSVAFALVLKRPAPLWEPQFHLPQSQAIDVRLLGGAALFGAGWGLAGVCPGPSLVAVTTLDAGPLVFAAAMVGGMALFHVIDRLRSAKGA
jgi:uncharacterized membrane protein YedE/YeeE